MLRALTKVYCRAIQCYFLEMDNATLIIVQRDETQSSLFTILQVHSICFGCQLHPSSGVHKTVTTASGTDHIFVQLPPSNVAKPHPTSAVHKTVTTASCNGHILCSYLPPTWPMYTQHHQQYTKL